MGRMPIYAHDNSDENMSVHYGMGLDNLTERKCGYFAYIESIRHKEYGVSRHGWWIDALCSVGGVHMLRLFLSPPDLIPLQGPSWSFRTICRWSTRCTYTAGIVRGRGAYLATYVGACLPIGASQLCVI